jgi:hypothetical protein
MGFCKVWFTGPQGETAGLVISEEKARKSSTAELSRMFPTSEFRKMAWLHVSPVYDTWDAAFAHVKSDPPCGAR